MVGIELDTGRIEVMQRLKGNHLVAVGVLAYLQVMGLQWQI